MHRKTVRRACTGWMLLAAALLLALPFAPSLAPATASEEGKVEYRLGVLDGEPPGLNVTLRFMVHSGEVVKLALGAETDPGREPSRGPQVQVNVSGDPRYTVEAAGPGDEGWTITALSDAEISVPYTVRFPSANAPVRDPDAPGGSRAPSAVWREDLKVLRGSDALLCPRRPGGAPVSSSFAVELPLEPGERALVPWKEVKRGSFSVSGVGNLLDNHLAWGELEPVRMKARGATVTTAFSSDMRLSRDGRRDNERALVSMYDYIAGKLGEREGLREITVLVCGAERFGLDSSTYSPGISSSVVFSTGEKLSGARAAAAAGGMFAMWNTYSMSPADGSRARWFQEGAQAFYPLRVAALNGLMGSKQAYESFSGMYRSYLTDPLAGSVSLAEAEGLPEAAPLLRNKGAAVVASLGRRLQEESRGRARDIDWLLGRLAAGFDGPGGKGYTIVDISEKVEEATGKSWDRFFAERVDGVAPVLASEFSASDLFGSTSVAGGIVDRGSGRNWALLLVAILVILLIPVIFSPYVRRAVKLDMTMPEIFPGGDD